MNVESIRTIPQRGEFHGSPRFAHGRTHTARFTTVALLFLISLPLFAQPSDASIEVFGMTGAYYFAQESHLFKSRRSAPHFGAGTLIPMNSKWGILLDGQLSRLELNEGLHDPLAGHPSSIFYRVFTNIPNEDVTIQWQLSIFPSIVRTWRKDRFSVYLGGGLGCAYDHQTIKHRPVHGNFSVNADGELSLDPNDSELVRSEDFEVRTDAIFAPILHVSGGVIVSISKSLLFRSGLTINPTALDAPLAKSLQFGIGFRF